MAAMAAHRSYDGGGLQVVTLDAAVDLSANQYRAVVISGELTGGRATVNKPAFAGQAVVGVQRNKLLYSKGDKATEVAYMGISVALGDGSVTGGSRVAAAGTSALFRKAQTGDWVRGMAVTGDGGVSGGRFSLHLQHMGKEP